MKNLSQPTTGNELAQIDQALRAITLGGRPPYSLIGMPSVFFGNSNLFPDKASASEGKDQLDKLNKACKDLEQALENSSDGQKDRISKECAFQSRWRPELTVGKIAAMQGIIDSLKSVLDHLAPGVSVEEQRISREWEGKWHGRGRGPDWYAREVALEIAKLFVREKLKMPTLGTGSVDGAPSTPYAKLVQQVFKILQIRTSFRMPCKWAIDRIPAEMISAAKEYQRIQRTSSLAIMQHIRKEDELLRLSRNG